MEDNKKRLYQALIADYDLGDFDTFAKDVEDSTKRKSLYDAISQDYDLGDFDSFTNQLLGSKPSSSDTPMAEKPAVATDNYVLPTPFLSEENKPFAEEHPMGLESQGEIITPFRAEDEKLTTTYQEALSKKGTDLGGPIDMEGTIAKARQTADFAGGVAGEIKAQSGNPFPPKLSATDLDAFKTPEQKAEENYFNRAGDQALYYLQAENQLDAELKAVEEELAALEKEYYKSEEYRRLLMMRSFQLGSPRQSWDDFASAPPRLRELQKRRTALLQAKEHKAVAEEIGRNKMEYGTVREYFSNALTGAKSFAKEKLSSVDPRNRSVEVLADKLSLSRKLTNGETLSSDEQDAWTIYALEDMMEGRYGKAKEDFGYIAGNAAPMMVEFMAELALSPGKGLAKGAMTAAERQAANMTQKLIRKYGATAVRKNLMRMGAGVYKQGARLSGATANAAIAAHTAQVDDLVKGTAERMAGTAVGTPDEQGNVVGTGVKDAKGLGRAYYEQAANMTIENLTEAIFEGAGIGKGFKSLLTGTGKKIAGTKVGGKVVGAAAKLADTKTVKAMSELIENTKSSNWYQSVSKLKLAGHLGSIPEEMMEEYAAIPLRHWLGVNDGEQGLWEELTSRQTFYNTAAGLSLGMGAMTAVQVVPPATAMAAGAVWDKYNMFRTHRNLIRRDKEGQNLFGAEWESVKTQIESFTEENFGEGMDALVEEFDSPEKKDAAWRYAQSLQQDRGFNAMRQKAKEEGESDPLADAREEGYEAENQQQIDAWKEEYDRLHAKWGSQVEEAVAQYGGLNLFFDTLRENPDGETAMREILRYYELKERIEGAEARKADEAETDEEALQSNVERRTNQETGKIVTVNILGDNGQPAVDIATGEPASYYVINGATDTGDGNVALSDGMVVLRDADGNRRALPGDKLRLVSVMQPEQIIAEERARAAQEAAAPVQEAAPAAVVGNSADIAAELEKTEEGRGVKEQVDAWFAQGEEPGAVEQLLSSTAGSFAPLGMDYYNALAAESSANAAPAAEPANAAVPAGGVAEASSAPTSRIMRKKGAIDAEASFENGATAQEMADAYMQDFGDEEGLALSTAQERLAQVQEERRNTKEVERKNGPLRKQEKFWNDVVDLLTPKEETVAEEGRQETVGTPVALQYLLEGGKGSIENAGYFFYAIQAAFPHIGAQLQEIRNSMPAEMLGMAPDAFVASNPSQLQDVRRLVEAAYGEAGTRILDQMLANSTGFYPREGKALDLEIENLRPQENAEGVSEEEASILQAGFIPEGERKLLTKDEISAIMDALEDAAVPKPNVEYTQAEWDARFKEPLDTPVGKVRMGGHQFGKLHPDGNAQHQDRRGWIGLIHETLTNPNVIVEQNAPEEGAERGYKYVFVKSFINSSGESVTYFASVSVKKEGMEVVITNHFKKYKDIKGILEKGKLCFSSISPSGMQTEPNQPSASATTSETGSNAGVSEGKVSESSSVEEGTQEEISENAQNVKSAEQNEGAEPAEPAAPAEGSGDKGAGQEGQGSKWRYSVHVDKQTGYTTLSREDASLAYPVGDGRWHPTAQSPEEMLGILRNPLNGMQEVLAQVEVTLENAIATRRMDQAIRERRKQEKKPKAPKNEGQFGLVSDTRMEELKEQLRKKLRGQLNAGLDPEILTIGMQIAVGHIDRGIKKFADFAKIMIEDLGDAIRPYLKAFYNGARDLPEVVDNGLDKEMTPYDEVRTFDTANFDKAVPDDMGAANIIVQEKNVEKHADEIEESGNKPVSLSGRTAVQAKVVEGIKQKMLSALEDGTKPFQSIVQVRNFAESLGMTVDRWGKTDILLQELVEDALVRAARELMGMMQGMVNEGHELDSAAVFEAIVKLYELQPTISMRSSNRVAMQQYSTPLPMAFVADAFVSAGNPATVLEPTAGNGMLVFAIPAERIHANELDETRLSNLREQGYDKVTRQDATLPFEGKYDAVVMNPPFGNAAAKDYDGYSISGLDPQIAINTLESMADNGRAAIIIGGNMEYADNGSIKGKKAFFSYLYDHYNVKGVVDMDGSLYQKQGTTYPTRMILIEGRRTEEERKRSTVYPPVESKALPKAETFEQLFEIVNELTNSNAKTNGHEVLRSSERPSGAVADNAPGRTDKRGRSGESSESDAPVERVRGGLDGGPSVLVVQQERGDTRDAGGRSGERGVHESGSNVPDGRVGVGRSESQSAAEHGRVEGQAGTAVGREAGVSEQRLGDVDGKDNTPGVPADGGTVLLEEKRGLDTDKLPYRPHNTAFSLESIAPAAMVEAMDETLKQIEAEHGNVEQWVQSELGYETLDDLHNALAAEQIDSVAMAIHQMQQGQALIIGDQTGVGKGRQMAALIRWAVRQGKKPIFVTQSANLFSDIYRDLVDIGSGELRPFIFNARNGENPGVIVDDKGEAVHKALTDNKQKKVFESGKLPDEFDFAVLTYSQVSSGDKISAELANANAKESGSRAKKSKSVESGKATPKATFLRAIAKDNYLFLDESHTAAGESNTGTYFQSLIKDAKAATFASATFAKRPDTMPLYALRTAMSKAKVEAHKLIDVIKKGGVTLQELMSRALTSAGQMVRRERDMRDVKTDWKTVSGEEIAKRARAEYDKAIEAFNAIIAFQNNYVKPYLKEQSKEMAQMMGSVKAKKGTENLGIDNVPFASKTYNYTKQLMLALKVDAIVEEVIAEIEAGRHPVIALESTMESSLDEYKPGDVVGNPSFGASLLKGLNSVMQYTVKTDKGYAVGGTVIPSDLGPEGEAEYYRVQQFINDSAKDIFVSPLDAIIRKLNERGYKVGELTGRKTFLEQNGEGDYVLRERTDRDKKRMTRDFNSGKLDVLILNKSASTGISLHASSRFEDQRQRTMIIAQPLSDINDYMQMIGRIDRTGQVHRGYYINLGLPIPAENRFLMMLSTKLKSLNANTTTSQDNESSSVEAPDLLNKYGDRVVVEYLRDNPDVYERIGEPLGSKTAKVTVDKLEEYTPQEDDARKITGRVALLPTEEQDAFYDEVVKRYNDLINYLNETNSNDLKITVLPLRAKTLSRSISSEGIDPTGSNPFARNAYVEEVEMDILRKPMSAKEVERTISQVNKGENPSDRIRSILQTVTEETKEKMAKEEERFRKAEAKMEEAIAKHDARIDAQKDMPDDAKAQAKASYRQQEQDKLAEKKAASESKIRFAHKSLVEKLGMFKPGQTYMMPDDLESLTYTTLTPAIFCGYKAKDSKITASTTFAVFATLDGRRRVEVKLSSSNAPVSISRATNENYDTARRTNLSNWDSQIPTGTRKKGYIMTGNILQAVSDSQSENGSFPGQLISYTDINGGVHDGLLMPDNWTPSLLRASGVPINARASQLKDGETLVSSDGKVTVSKHRNYRGDYYLLEVPKSKKEGGKYYSDNSILAFVEDNVFFQHHGKFVAHVPAENIDRVLNALAKLGVAVPGEVKQVEAEENETVVRHNEGFAGSKNEKNARIIPSDVEKEVSLQIEREFDDAVKELGELLPSEESEDFESRFNNRVRKYRNMETSELEEDYEKKKAGLLSALGLDMAQAGETTSRDIGQDSADVAHPGATGIMEAIRRGGKKDGLASGVREAAILLAAAERELHYRRHRRNVLGSRHGLHSGDELPLARVREIFKATNTDAEVNELFDKAYEVAERLGVEVMVREIDPERKNSKGSMSMARNMYLNLEPFTRTGNDAMELPVTIAHELIHHATIYMIELYNGGRADLLTDSQKKAVETIIDIYNKYKEKEDKNKKEGKAGFENPYGLKDAEEFAAQMADPRQRRELSATIWSRAAQAYTEAKKNGEGWFNRLVKAIKALFSLSDKKKMDNAIDSLIESFNEEDYKKVAEGQVRILHNDAAPSRGTAPADAIRRAYDGEMRTARFLTKETMVDYLASVKALLDTIAKKTGKGITDPQNVYRAMLTLTNKNTQELAAFDYGVLPHMTKAIAGIMGKEWNGDWDAPEAATLQRYAKVKHGIERDRDMAVRRAIPRMAEQKYREQFGALDRMIAAESNADAREALRTKKATMLADPKAYGMQTADEIAEQMEQQWYDRIAEIRRGEGTWREKQQRMDAAIADVFGLDAEGLETYGLTLTEDYSGMTETLIAEGEIDRKTARKVSGAARAAAYDFVEQYEERTGADKTDALWDGVRAVSAYSLEKQRSTGLVDAKYVEDCKRRYEFYVPLRNFAETTADEVYDYLDETYNDNNPVKTARGRRSEAGNPFSNVMMLGYQSITAGNKNAAVQHFWNLANRTDVKGFLVPSRTWHLAELDDAQREEVNEKLGGIADTTGDVILPRIPENATAQQAQEMLNDFEDVMKDLKKRGLAFQGKKRARQEYRLTSKQQENAHRVKVYVNGEARYVTIVGDPRAALALNGKLNPESGVPEKYKAMQQFLSGAFTSQNPSFALANIIRDTQHANMRAFITESGKYWAKFSAKQAAMMKPGRLAFLLAKYENSMGNTGRHGWGGELDMRNETHRNFKRFMELGGATGYTFSHKEIENLKKLADMAERAENKTPKGQGYVVGEIFDFIRLCSESAELINRFAAFEASLEAGRSEQRAISDAQEITLNFSRKGAGKKSYNANRNLKGKTWLESRKYNAVNAIAWLSQFGRDHLIFWNAAVQGSYQTYKMIMEHPAKTTFALGGVPIALSAFALPALNAVICAFMGDDEDSYYDELPDYVRQRNLCIKNPFGKGWLKIPLDPATQKVWAAGDAIAAAWRGKRQIDYWGDLVANAVGLFSPVDIYWGDRNDNLSERALSAATSFTPTLIQPLLHSYANRDWKGKPLYNDSRYIDQLPSYAKSFKSDKESLKALSKFLNDVGNSDADSYGRTWHDFATPGVMEELLYGYTGGYGQLALAAVEGAIAIVSDDAKGNFRWDNMPMVNRLWVEGDPGQTRLNIYRNYRDTAVDFMENVEQRRSQINREYNEAKRSHDTLAQAEALAKMKQLHDGDYQRYEILHNSDKLFQKYMKGSRIEDVPDFVIKGMLEAIEIVNNPDGEKEEKKSENDK